MKKWPPKDKDERLNYGFDWSPRDIGTAVITETTAVVLIGTVVVDVHGPAEVEGVASGKGTETWLMGGTPGETNTILLHAKTNGGHELEETITIKIKER